MGSFPRFAEKTPPLGLRNGVLGLSPYYPLD
jgi:hypothetical protein